MILTKSNTVDVLGKSYLILSFVVIVDSGLSGKVKRNNLLATTDTWGPLFWVSLDLIIHKPVPDWSTVLAFKAHDAKSNYGTHGDRFPCIFLREIGNRHYLRFASSVNGNPNYFFDYNNVKTNNWYKLVVQQVAKNGKVRLGGEFLYFIIFFNRFTSSYISMGKRFTKLKIKTPTRTLQTLKSSLGIIFIKRLMRATRTWSGRTF